MAAQVGMRTDKILHHFTETFFIYLAKYFAKYFTSGEKFLVFCLFSSPLTSCPRGHILELKVPWSVADLL